MNTSLMWNTILPCIRLGEFPGTICEFSESSRCRDVTLPSACCTDESSGTIMRSGINRPIKVESSGTICESSKPSRCRDPTLPSARLNLLPDIKHRHLDLRIYFPKWDIGYNESPSIHSFQIQVNPCRHLTSVNPQWHLTAKHVEFKSIRKGT